MSGVNQMRIPEMYNLITRQNVNWGVDGYKVPTKYFDHVRSRKDKEMAEMVSKKVKRRCFNIYDFL